MDLQTCKKAVFLTERLELRAVRADDSDAMIPLANDFEVARRLTRMPHPYGEEEARQFIETILPGEAVWAIIRSADNAFMGAIGLHNPDGESAKLGYWLGQDYWGRGYMTEAAAAIARFAFETLKLSYLGSGHFADNSASASVLAKLGFVPIGKSRQYSAAVGAEVDHVDVRLEAKDFQNKQAQTGGTNRLKMQKREFAKLLAKTKVVPVIRHKSLDIAYRGAMLLAEAGFPVLEITFTVPDAADLIAKLSRDLPNATIGAGTVLTDLQVHHAIRAGAKFVVSPCWVDDAAEICIMENISYLPGAATPGEILHHWQGGALAVKIFPAHETGGPGFLKAVKAVFPDIPLMPTGGVKPEQVGAYLKAGAICTGLGGDLFPAAALEAGDEDKARELIGKAMEAMALDETEE